MAKKEKQYCPHCGASMNEHRHTISKALINGLRKLHAQRRRTNLKLLGLTRNEWDNFQKLRYWGLVYQVEVDGKRQNGVWWLTQKGANFLSGAVAIPKHVWTYRGERVRYEGKVVFVGDVETTTYRKRKDYAADAKAH